MFLTLTLDKLLNQHDTRNPNFPYIYSTVKQGAECHPLFESVNFLEIKSVIYFLSLFYPNGDC